jgi:hypothetical protein
MARMAAISSYGSVATVFAMTTHDADDIAL